MTLVGLDLNATRACAVNGPAGLMPKPLALDENDSTLPLALSLEGRRPQVGRAGAGLCRQFPHLVCHDFLAALGTPRQWIVGRKRLDACRALSLVLEKLGSSLGDSKGVTISLPAYLGPSQAALIPPLARKAKMHVLGTMSGALAAALAAYTEQPFSGAVIMVDVDDHALTWSILSVVQEQLRFLTSESLPHLGLTHWKACLLEGIADVCIRHSRRDFRDSGAAEQHLYEQLDTALDSCSRGELVEVVIRAATWCQNLILQPQQIETWCSYLVQETLEEISAGFRAVPGPAPDTILMTAAASLPGLITGLRNETRERVGIVPLDSDAAARGAHFLAAVWQRAALGLKHLDEAVPLPKVDTALAKGVIPMASLER
jgi:hypothetical protein